jgi:hypothetical protein
MKATSGSAVWPPTAAACRLLGAAAKGSSSIAPEGVAQLVRSACDSQPIHPAAILPGPQAW